MMKFTGNQKDRVSFYALMALSFSVPATAQAADQAFTTSLTDQFYVSDSGQIYTGSYGQDSSGLAYAEWTTPGGVYTYVTIGDVAGGADNSVTVEMADDFSAAAGTGEYAGGSEAFFWSQGTGLIPIGFLGGQTDSNAVGISADGSTVIGRSGVEGFKWTQGGGIVGLGLIAGGSFSDPRDVSRDGSVIVGYADDATTQQAFRWTQGSGMVGLGVLPGSTWSEASGVSGNGQVVVGYSEYGMGGEGFVWTQAGGMVGIGFVESAGLSNALFTDYTGTNVFGYSHNGDYIMMRWRADTGSVSIAQILTDEGVDVSNYHLDWITDTSADGKYLVGNATTIDTSDPVYFWANLSAGGFITDEDIDTSLHSFRPLHQEAIERAGLQVSQSLYAARLRPMFFDRPVPVSIDASRPDMISPAAGGDGGRRISGYVVGSLLAGQDQDLDNWGVNGTAGFKFPVTNSFTIGIGLNGSKSDTNGNLRSNTEMVSKGGSIISSYIGESGLRLYSALFASRVNTTTRRGYISGTDLEFSYGETSGHAYGGAVHAGWMFPVTTSTSVEPFVEGQISKIHLDGYTETDGPFPATFSDQSEISSTQKIGAQVLHDIDSDLQLSAQLGLVHLTRGGTSAVIASIAGSNFLVAESDDTDRNWVEVGVGVNYNISDSLNISAELNGSAVRAQAPVVGLNVGLSYSF